DVPVPDGIVAEEVHRHLEGEDRLEDDEHRAEVEVEARKSFKAQLLLDAVAEKVEVSVNQEELVEYIVASAQQYGMDPNAFAKAVDEAGQVRRWSPRSPVARPSPRCSRRPRSPTPPATTSTS